MCTTCYEEISSEEIDLDDEDESDSDISPAEMALLIQEYEVQQRARRE